MSFCPTIYFYQNICFYQRELFSIVFPKILSKTMNYFRKDLGILRPASTSQKFWRNVNPLELLRVPAALLNIFQPIQTFCRFCNPTPLTICGACSENKTLVIFKIRFAESSQGFPGRPRKDFREAKRSRRGQHPSSVLILLLSGFTIEHHKGIYDSKLSCVYKILWLEMRYL